MIDEDVETFLAHHGVKGQKWGIRNKARLSNKVANSQNYQMTVNTKTQKYSKITKDSGNARSKIDRSIRATIKERKRLRANGSLSAEAYHKGNVRLGRNVTLALLGGGAVGYGLGKLIVKRVYDGNKF